MRIIGIGHNCSIAVALRTAGWVHRNNVFDNMWTADLSGLVDLLECRGAGFFEEYEMMGEHNKASHKILDVKFNIRSVHGVPLDLDKHDAIKHLMSKKKPLLKKFFLGLEGDGELMVLRTNANWTGLATIVRLHDVIKDIRQEKPFHLCVFQDAEFCEHDWGIDGLELYRAESPSYCWNQKAWNYPTSWQLAVKSLCVRHGLAGLDRFQTIKVL